MASALGSRLSALGSRLSALGSRLSALGSRLSALGSRLSALGSRLSALGSRLSRLSALGSRLSALGSRLSALGSRLSALGSRLSALGSRLSALGSRLSALGSRLSALKEPWRRFRPCQALFCIGRVGHVGCPSSHRSIPCPRFEQTVRGRCRRQPRSWLSARDNCQLSRQHVSANRRSQSGRCRRRQQAEGRNRPKESELTQPRWMLRH